MGVFVSGISELCTYSRVVSDISVLHVHVHVCTYSMDEFNFNPVLN